MSEFIPLSVPNLKGNELTYVTEAIESEWVSGGPFIGKFEENFAEYAKADSMVACQSGTAAIHLALMDLGIGMGDLVLAPALTFIATVNPISYTAAEPVFLDCDDSLCIDTKKLEKYLKAECEKRDGTLYDKGLGKPIRAIIPVHVFGNSVNMEHVMDLSAEYGIPVIEDATEAIGSFFTKGRYAGKMAGTIGHYGAYSFNGNKIMTTGSGGMVTAQSAESIAHMRHISTQAKFNEVYFTHDEIGYNYRMTNLQAALGIAQLEQLEAFIETKKDNYYHYQESGLKLLPFNDNIRPNYWFYSYLSEYRDELIQYLDSENIQTRPIWGLIHEQPMYKGCKAFEVSAAKAYYGKVVNLPCSSNLTKENTDRVIAAITSFNQRMK